MRFFPDNPSRCVFTKDVPINIGCRYCVLVTMPSGLSILHEYVSRCLPLLCSYQLLHTIEEDETSVRNVVYIQESL
ncbi:hypothetical protein K432DRAFT_40042 [Lepidopterella palustris CBS 459.81]|uniref:Uncharacterized protein n=1 Tax=Lepidopterella palustris CBS 459.81 TaxID=1314670 RepID=A0A8E2JKJ2_9PEZI|nr:hypothetical protein K432DRAFT_40042 [Lepidopterella palustris CBS 459.81]